MRGLAIFAVLCELLLNLALDLKQTQQFEIVHSSSEVVYELQLSFRSCFVGRQ